MVGVPHEALFANGALQTNAGAVHVIRGSSAGLTTAGSQVFHQDIGAMNDFVEDGDLFGASLAVSNIDSGPNDDLIIGVPGESDGAVSAAGAIQILLGVGGVGLSDAGNVFWTQNSANVPDSSESGDRFGYAVGAVPFTDVLVGLPNEGEIQNGASSSGVGWVGTLETPVVNGVLTVAQTSQKRNMSNFGEGFASLTGFGYTVTAPRPGR